MYKFGLIGYPLGHSISAVIQHAGLQDIGLEGSYEAFETKPEDLLERIKFFKRNDFNGFNITIPLKTIIYPYLDDIDEKAGIVGCVNTVKINPDKTLAGSNTDIYGFKSAVPKTINLKGKAAAILGTGGAARAAVAGLSELGISHIDFYTRNIINSNQVLSFLREKFPNISFSVYQIQHPKNLSNISILVNATPIGMRGYMMDEMPLFIQDLETLPKDAVVYDIIYNPTKTLLIQHAERIGLQTISGLDMLIYQAQKSIELWTGKTPDTKVMKIAALEAL